MSEEWTEWREHSGGPGPAGHEFVQVRFRDEAECWRWGEPCGNIDGDYARVWEWRHDHNACCDIIRYRIRKPKALEQLRQIARDVETPLVNTPKEPVRA